MRGWPYWDCPKKDDPQHVCDGYCLPDDYIDRWKEIKRRDYENLPVTIVTKSNALLRWVKKTKRKEKKP